MSAMIRLLRKNSNDLKNDDVITMKRVANETIRVTFSNATATVKHVATLDNKEAWNWLRNILGLLTADADPFEGVQLDFPLTPSIMVDVRELDQHYHRIMDAMEFFLDNEVRSVKKARAPEEEDEDDDDDDSMPELLPRDLMEEINAPADPLNTAFRYFNPNDTVAWTRGRHHLFLDSNEEFD
jgi:hypothetical protein